MKKLASESASSAKAAQGVLQRGSAVPRNGDAPENACEKCGHSGGAKEGCDCEKCDCGWDKPNPSKKVKR
jgi:hypothetical protein